ncbi:MAG: hypothetical protein JHD16_06415 [Solirubrobacteraceae bacterium]|nr:hypothetical protein [Solirubrobacteraceae bacterium]
MSKERSRSSGSQPARAAVVTNAMPVPLLPLTRPAGHHAALVQGAASRGRAGHRLRAISSAVTATVLATLALPGAAAAADRVELPIRSSSPQTDVISSLVRLHVPLPATAPAHSEACDWIQYMRYRPADGPSEPTDADAVAVLMPGFIEGATAFDPVARNTIRESARRGRSIEVWAIDRRANCLEDLTGVDHVEQTGEIDGAIDYYYGKQPLNGQTFTAPFNRAPKVLAEFGIAQTMRDYHAVLTTELPSQPWREDHVICGGHSLGGPLTELYAAWDFDGDKTTTADAGFRQCAGFMGFDTTLSGKLSGGLDGNAAKDPDPLVAGVLQSISDVTVRSLRAGAAPRNIDISGIGPETMMLLDAVSVLASRTPDADWTPALSKIPRSATTDQFFHISGSPNMSRWLFSKDSMREVRYSYMAALGQIMDDNGAVFGLVRSSFGFFDGAPIQRNTLPRDLSKIPIVGQFVAPGELFVPQKLKSKPLVRWKNYDELGSGATQIGRGGTTPAAEVTDARDMARILHEGPTNLIEAWFPTRIMLDQYLIAGGDRSGGLRGLQHPTGVRQKPRFVVIAGDGLRAGGRRQSDPHVTLPGYQHLDVLTAAERQNSGQPEGSSQAFADLIDTALDS